MQSKWYLIIINNEKNSNDHNDSDNDNDNDNESNNANGLLTFFLLSFKWLIYNFAMKMIIRKILILLALIFY